jgi:hypothetical protein
MPYVDVPIPPEAALKIHLALLDRMQAEVRAQAAEQQAQALIALVLQVYYPHLPAPTGGVQFDPQAQRLQYEVTEVPAAHATA